MAAAAEAVGEKLAALSFEELVAQKKPYYDKRIQLFEQYKARQDAAVEAARAAPVPITVTLPDGGARQGVRGVTTPLDIANEISKGLAKKVLVAKVDGASHDLFRPLDGDCALQLFTFEEPEGKDVRAAAASARCALPPGMASAAA